MSAKRHDSDECPAAGAIATGIPQITQTGHFGRARSCQVPVHLRVQPEPEHFQKYCSRSGGNEEKAVFLVFGFVSAQLQGFSNLLLRRSLAKNQKSSLRTATVFFQTLKER
jgi:hypothetical protein